jgi:hypothetical protein
VPDVTTGAIGQEDLCCYGTNKGGVMTYAGGALIFGVFIVIALLVFVYATYTRRGSGINQHPYMNPYGDAPGAWRKSSLTHDPRASIRFPRGLR